VLEFDFSIDHDIVDRSFALTSFWLYPFVRSKRLQEWQRVTFLRFQFWLLSFDSKMLPGLFLKNLKGKCFWKHVDMQHADNNAKGVYGVLCNLFLCTYQFLSPVASFTIINFCILSMICYWAASSVYIYDTRNLRASHINFTEDQILQLSKNNLWK
jgi:hypothetical protein